MKIFNNLKSVFNNYIRLEEISGNIVDVLNNEIYSGTIFIENGKIKNIQRDNKKYQNYIIPGFIDSHIHVESTHDSFFLPQSVNFSNG